jgi:hypothetical protein
MAWIWLPREVMIFGICYNFILYIYIYIYIYFVFVFNICCYDYTYQKLKKKINKKGKEGETLLLKFFIFFLILKIWKYLSKIEGLAIKNLWV